MENDSVCVTEAVVFVKGKNIVTTIEGAIEINAEERLLKKLRKIFESKVHDDIPSAK